MYYAVEPEVAGGWGENTRFTRAPGTPTVIDKLHYEFDGWLGDELLESSPCYIASERLAGEIERARLTGVTFDEVEVATSRQFRDSYPDRRLPKFVWLRVNGVPGQDDFGVSPGLLLIVSERALDVLHRRIARGATVTPLNA